MSSLRTGLASLAALVACALPLATAPVAIGATEAPSLKVSLPAPLPAYRLLPASAAKRKLVRSCNKGDNRKRHGSAALDAWAVACEFPPNSRLSPASALDTAATIAALGG